jgi:N-acetyl-anhydromuramyl-L-alanine amidase AmpD
MAFIITYKCRHNSGAMPKGDVDYIVLHRTEGHLAGDIATLVSGGGRSVSIHFLISRGGKVYRMLPMNVGANHAGFGHHRLAAKYGNANQHAFGIELSGMGNESYTEAQLMALDDVIRYIDDYLGSNKPITTHAAIDPDRKSDPLDFKWLGNYNEYRRYSKLPRMTVTKTCYMKDALLRTVHKLQYGDVVVKVGKSKYPNRTIVTHGKFRGTVANKYLKA